MRAMHLLNIASTATGLEAVVGLTRTESQVGRRKSYI